MRIGRISINEKGSLSMDSLSMASSFYSYDETLYEDSTLDIRGLELATGIDTLEILDFKTESKFYGESIFRDADGNVKAREESSMSLQHLNLTAAQFKAAVLRIASSFSLSGEGGATANDILLHGDMDGSSLIEAKGLYVLGLDLTVGERGFEGNEKGGLRIESKFRDENGNVREHNVSRMDSLGLDVLELDIKRLSLISTTLL